jgi:acyl-CoA synthetase (AMP-forming)/AMP-acid ligase II
VTRLFDALERFDARLALIDEGGLQVTYAELLARADAIVGPLGETRRLVFIEIENALEPIAAYVGALRAGHAVVLTGEGGAAPESRLAKTFPPEFVFARRQGRWSFEARPAPTVELHPDLAVLLSTSGSTGSPKLVRLSHRNLLANAVSIAEYLGFQDGERAITALPPSYSYGMSVINSHLVTGQALILSGESISDEAFWRRFDKHGATSFAGVPHSYELLEHSGFLATEHPSLRYFTQAGGRLPPEKVVQFADWAAERGHRFYVMYGQTEAGPRMAYLPPEVAAKHPDCIGRAIPGGELSIEDGELVYRGPNVMMGYALSPADLAKGAELTELRTGDLATQVEGGLFKIIGRASRFSKIFGLRIGLDEVEQTLKDAGIDGVATGDDEGLVVAVTAQGREAEARRLLAEKLKLPASRISVTALGAIPRNASGKVDYPAVLRLRQPVRVAGDLRSQLAEILGVETMEDGDTFVGLGGDSLSYVQASLALESLLGVAPDDWENTPVAELEQAIPTAPGKVATMETSAFVRAVAILAVVFKHVSDWDFGGSATALLIVAGMNFSRFQLPRLMSGGAWGLLKSTALRVALPYYVVLSIYFAIVGGVFWPQYLLFSNFTEGMVFEGTRRFQIYWFIEVYLTLILGFCALFLIPQVRQLAKARPREFVLGLFGLVLALAGVSKFYGELPIFFPHTPISFSYIFIYGWVIDRLKSLTAKLVLVGVGGLIMLFLPPDDVWTAIPIAGAATLLLLFVKRVPVGDVLAKGLSVIAAASLYIYIFHGLMLHAGRTLLGGTLEGWEVPAVFLACVAFSLAVWRGVELATSRPRRAAVAQWLGRQTQIRPSRGNA